MSGARVKNRNRRTGALLVLFIACLAGFAWAVALLKN